MRPATYPDPAYFRAFVTRWCGGADSARIVVLDGVDEALLVAQPGYARRQVEKRDHGVCAVCGLDCQRIERLIERLGRLAQAVAWVRERDGKPVASHWQPQPDGSRVTLVRHPAAEKAARNVEIALAIISLWAGHDLRKLDSWSWDSIHGRGRWMRLKHSLWQADHIKPVVEGGGGCGLDNYRTLCLRCHKGATAQLAHRRRRQLEIPT